VKASMNVKKLYSLVSDVCYGNYSPGQLVEFINIAQKIAVSYLRYQEITGKNIRPKYDDDLVNLEDISVDCIAGLFMRNEEGEFIHLKKYFHVIIESKEKVSNELVLMMLRRLVIKKTKQELSRIFRERDPEGAKILRNIRVAIRSSMHFEVFKEMGREFVHLVRVPDTGAQTILRRDVAEIPFKQLYQQFVEMYSSNDSVAVMMKKMLSIVEENSDFQNYLAVDVIAANIREITFQQFNEQLQNTIDAKSPFDDLQLKEVIKVNENILQYIHNKINNQYLSKNKIDDFKADIYKRAIYDFIQDFTNAKECDSNFRYLKKYIPNLTQQDYREKERSIFEYLVKVTKKSLRKKLKELL
jgi:hypothetical protein